MFTLVWLIFYFRSIPPCGTFRKRWRASHVMAGNKSPTLKWLGKIAASLEADASVLLQLRDAPASTPGVVARRR